MKKIIVLLVLLATASTYAQLSVNELVNQGIKFHDAGEYEKAIETYKMALEVDKESILANYEIALSYFSSEKYALAIKHADKVIEKNKDNLVGAYLIKGSALDMQGKTEESINTYKSAIEKTWGHHLFYYNIALDYYKIKDLNNAEKYAIEALNANFEHGSSHLLLANINFTRNNKVETILGASYFLLIEQNTSRSKNAYNMITKSFNGNVSKEEGSNKVTVNITMPEKGQEDDFTSAELALGIAAANNHNKKEEGATDFEILISSMDTLISLLHETATNSNESIYFTKYIPFFKDVKQNGHLEALCAYIAAPHDTDAEKWLDENQEKLHAFGKWVNGEEE